MARNSERWKRIDRLLDQILDPREVREQERVAKIIRQRSRNSAWPSDSTPPAPARRRR